MSINVRHIAKLANLTLTDDEVIKFEKQLTETLQYIAQLQEVDTKNITATSQVTALENIFREDEVSPSLTQKDALSNVKPRKNGFFQVKGILDNQ